MTWEKSFETVTFCLATITLAYSGLLWIGWTVVVLRYPTQIQPKKGHLVDPRDDSQQSSYPKEKSSTIFIEVLILFRNRLNTIELRIAITVDYCAILRNFTMSTFNPTLVIKTFSTQVFLFDSDFSIYA